MDINRATARMIGLVLVALVAGGCTIPSLAPVQTATPAISPPAAAPPAGPTACGGPWNWAYGVVSPEFIEQVQGALAAAGFNGTVESSTFGETDGCGEYHAKDVDYVFALQVDGLDSGAGLDSASAQILEIAQRFLKEGPAPNLGHLVLVFQAGGQQCRWFYDAGAWSASTLSGSIGSACPAPATP